MYIPLCTVNFRSNLPFPSRSFNLAVLNAKKQASIRKKKAGNLQPLIKPEELAKKPSNVNPASP
jgi:hypothetical protein